MSPMFARRTFLHEHVPERYEEILINLLKNPKAEITCIYPFDYQPRTMSNVSK